jgi:pyruvate,water dikinase
MSDAADAVLWLAEERCREVACAGGKGAGLAAMTAAGLPVPPGFVVSAWVLEQAVDADRLRALALAGDHGAAQALVHEAGPPRDAVSSAYRQLGEGVVAVRSSACAEDSDAASYAGQQETFLNVSGDADVRRRIVECWASFFSERALFYRARKGSLDDLRMAVVVQQMVEPRKSGVLFTVDPVQRRRDRMVVEAVFGLGEQLVSGHETPDHYVIDRAGISKREQLVHGGVLEPDELARLAELGRKLEERFGGPQDVEWAIAGGDLFLLQSRPVTTA